MILLDVLPEGCQFLVHKDHAQRCTEKHFPPVLQARHVVKGPAPADERGDILIFVSGAYEVDTLVAAINDWNAKRGLGRAA